jgi:dihydrofolate synthase / folylpolyglutamate synthase
MNYEEAIAYLQSFPDSERGSTGLKGGRNLKMPLAAMRSFLQTIDNPQNAAKTIHVTGSKGKGSTATFIASILQKAGFRTALFTSPHIHSYTERIAFDLQPISENLFSQGITELKPFIDEFEKQENVFSTFGILTALFFHLVKKARPAIDWQIVEVGLGGKDDLTNVFDKKEAAVITPISLEHTAILGSTRQSIAENKAGIITPGCLTILATQADRQVEEIIKSICQQKGSQFISSAAAKLPCPIKMHGKHQIDNAQTAYALAQALKEKYRSITEDSIIEGLSSVSLPGRFEIFDTNIVLDGAHNGDSALALAQTLEDVFPGQPVVFIIGVNEDKNLEEIFLALKSKAKKIIATRSDSYRALSPEEIRDRILICEPSTDITCKNNINQALVEANSHMTSNTVICICGSFYLVAEARTILLHNRIVQGMR